MNTPTDVPDNVVEYIADVLAGMTGRVDRAQRERAAVDDLPVGDPTGGVTDVVAGRNDVLRPCRPGQFEATGHIVVVQMGFEHVRDTNSELADASDYPVDVTLRIDDDRGSAIEHHIASVAQARGFDDLYAHTLTLIPQGTPLIMLNLAPHPAPRPVCRGRRLRLPAHRR